MLRPESREVKTLPYPIHDCKTESPFKSSSHFRGAAIENFFVGRAVTLVMIPSCLRVTIFLKCVSTSCLCQWNRCLVPTYQGQRRREYRHTLDLCFQNLFWNLTQTRERGVDAVLCPGKLSAHSDPLYFYCYIIWQPLLGVPPWSHWNSEKWGNCHRRVSETVVTYNDETPCSSLLICVDPKPVFLLRNRREATRWTWPRGNRG